MESATNVPAVDPVGGAPAAATDHARKGLDSLPPLSSPAEGIRELFLTVKTIRELALHATQGDVADVLHEIIDACDAILSAPPGAVDQPQGWQEKQSLCDCGKPATCIGAYEGQQEATFACDDCCGHGNEDGRCEQIQTTVSMDVLNGVTVAGARAFWRMKDLEVRLKDVMAAAGNLANVAENADRHDTIPKYVADVRRAVEQAQAVLSAPQGSTTEDQP